MALPVDFSRFFGLWLHIIAGPEQPGKWAERVVWHYGLERKIRRKPAWLRGFRSKFGWELSKLGAHDNADYLAPLSASTYTIFRFKFLAAGVFRASAKAVPGLMTQEYDGALYLGYRLKPHVRGPPRWPAASSDRPDAG